MSDRNIVEITIAVTACEYLSIACTNAVTTDQTGPAILYFDYVITLNEEIRVIWSNPFSFAPLCYFVNRYIPLVFYVPILSLFHNPTWTKEVRSSQLDLIYAH